MKKIILLAFMACVSMGSFAQEPLSFSKVIQADSASKDIIYSTLLNWIQTNYKGITNDTQLSDKEAGYIMKDAAIAYVKTGFYQCYGGFIYYKMKFQIKDGRFKVELSNFTHKITKTNCAFDAQMGIITNADENPLGGGMNKSGHNKVWKELQTICAEKANELFLSLEKLDFKQFDNSSDNW